MKTRFRSNSTSNKPLFSLLFRKSRSSRIEKLSKLPESSTCPSSCITSGTAVPCRCESTTSDPVSTALAMVVNQQVGVVRFGQHVDDVRTLGVLQVGSFAQRRADDDREYRASPQTPAVGDRPRCRSCRAAGDRAGSGSVATSATRRNPSSALRGQHDRVSHRAEGVVDQASNGGAVIDNQNRTLTHETFPFDCNRQLALENLRQACVQLTGFVR